MNGKTWEHSREYNTNTIHAYNKYVMINGNHFKKMTKTILIELNTENYKRCLLKWKWH